jgi:hypothetical protein
MEQTMEFGERKTIVFCYTGGDFSRAFLESWTKLLIELTEKGYVPMMAPGQASMEHFARSACLVGSIMAGSEQKPFQGQIKYDWIFWLDRHMVFEPNDFFKLLETPHEVTSGSRFDGGVANFALAWEEDYYVEHGCMRAVTKADADEMLAKGLRYVEVECATMDWMLIRPGVIERTTFPWFTVPQLQVGECRDMCGPDISFCRKVVVEADAKIVVDLQCVVRHCNAEAALLR